MKLENFKSIDGSFDGRISKSIFYKNINKKFSHTILGKGQSISGLPFEKNSKIIKLNQLNKIQIKGKGEVLVSADVTVVDLHNFLQKKNLYASYFPSYPNVTIGGCVANCVHGINPKNGIISNYIKEIEIISSLNKPQKISKTKNIQLFDTTIGGMGSTGVILNVLLKVSKIKSSYLGIKKIKFNSLYGGYKILKRSKNFYNQNNFFINYENNNFILGNIFTGDFIKKKIFYKKLKINYLPKLRLGLLANKFFIKIFYKTLYIMQNLFYKKKIHINDALYPSNSRIAYFALMPKKFIEFQNIIPNENVRNYLFELENLIKKKNPTITLGHLKIFHGNKKLIRFNGNGLAITLHLIIDDKFKDFYPNLLKLNIKYNCNLNLYKNSKINVSIIKKTYRENFKIFKKNLSKSRTKNYTNSLFGKFQQNL